MHADTDHWIYTKLYFGDHADRADSFIVGLGRLLDAATPVSRWFFIRYVDGGGFHLRLRVAPAPGAVAAALALVRNDVAVLFNRMYEFLPSTYRPMISLPDYLQEEPPVPGAPLRMVEDLYEPETDKYGAGESMRAAERLFCLSSHIAWRVLELEQRGIVSRKSVAPWLMLDTNKALPSFAHDEYWRDYSLYWLGGHSPAAADWRARFKRKAEALKAAGDDVLDSLSGEAAELTSAWCQGLRTEARHFAAVTNGRGRDVVSLNLAHLSMNRLGLATLEESFLATLLEHQAEPVA